MAYKQAPGRGNAPKTGNGLPSVLKQMDDQEKKGNSDGYNPKTSPVPNSENKGGYEKKLDKTKTDLFLRGGDNKIIKSARIGSKGAEAIESEYNKMKNYTESRRASNLEFLKSRQSTGVMADAKMKSPMKQGLGKKY